MSSASSSSSTTGGGGGRFVSPGREARLAAAAQLLKNIKQQKQQRATDIVAASPAAAAADLIPPRAVRAFTTSTKWVEDQVDRFPQPRRNSQNGNISPATEQLAALLTSPAVAAAPAGIPIPPTMRREQQQLLQQQQSAHRSSSTTWSDIGSVGAGGGAATARKPTSAATDATLARHQNTSNRQTSSSSSNTTMKTVSQNALLAAAATATTTTTRDSSTEIRGNNSGQSFGALAAHKRRMAETELRQMRYEDVLLRKKNEQQKATTTTRAASAAAQKQRNNAASDVFIVVEEKEEEEEEEEESLLQQQQQQRDSSDFLDLQQQRSIRGEEADRQLHQRSMLVEREMDLLRLKSKIDGQQPFLTSTGDVSFSLPQQQQRGSRLVLSSNESAAKLTQQQPPFLSSSSALPMSPVISSSSAAVRPPQQQNQNQRRVQHPQHEASSLSSSTAAPFAKYVVGSRGDASLHLIADPALAFETQDHRALLRELAAAPSAFLPQKQQHQQNSSFASTIPSLEHDDDRQQQHHRHQLPVHFQQMQMQQQQQASMPFDSRQLSRPEQHRTHGLNDSAAFAASSRQAAKQQAYQSTQLTAGEAQRLLNQQQQLSLAGMPLQDSSRLFGDTSSAAVSGLNQSMMASSSSSYPLQRQQQQQQQQFPTELEMTMADPILRQVAPDLALAQRDFAARAQHVRQRVTETRLAMALRAVIDWEQRERLILRVAEALDRGTFGLLLRHLAQRVVIVQDEETERREMGRVSDRDVRFVSMRVALKKDERARRQELEEQRGNEVLLDMKRRLEKGAAAFKEMIVLVHSEEPASRGELLSQAWRGLLFLTLRCVERMEEQHRAFLLVGSWCGTEEAMQRVRDDFDIFFESASERSMRSNIASSGYHSSSQRNHHRHHHNHRGGWIGPGIPIKGQFALNSDVVDAASDRAEYQRMQMRKLQKSSGGQHQQQQQQPFFYDPTAASNSSSRTSSTNNNPTAAMMMMPPMSPIAPGQAPPSKLSKSGSAPAASAAAPPHPPSSPAATAMHGFLPPTGRELTDGEIIFAQLTRAAQCLSDQYKNKSAVTTTTAAMMMMNSSATPGMPISPSVNNPNSNQRWQNNNNNSSPLAMYRVLQSAFPSDKQLSLSALYSPAEQARKATLTSHLVALRRGDDIDIETVPASAIYLRRIAEQGIPPLPSPYDARHATFHSSSSPVVDNFSHQDPRLLERKRQQRQQQHEDEFGFGDVRESSLSSAIIITTIRGLHIACNAVLEWNGWLPVSVYFSVLVPFARLLRDEAVSRLALLEGEQYRMRAINGQKALDLGNRMTRALHAHSENVAARLATSRVKQQHVLVRKFGGNVNNNNNGGRRTVSGAMHDVSSATLRHDLKLFRLGDPDKQGFVALPSMVAVLRCAPDLVGLNRDVFECCTVEDIAVLFKDAQEDAGGGRVEDKAISMSTMAGEHDVLTFPEFRTFMQTLRQVMSE